MTQRRVTATSQLATIIRVIQLGRKSGILTVERGEGATFEEGTITFQLGQAVSATIGTLQGQQASTILFAWQECHFSFVPTQTQRPQTQQLSPAYPAPINQGPTPPSHPLPANNFPAYQSSNFWDRQPRVAMHEQPTENILHAIDAQGLSRIHRRLYLLIDGRRTIREIAALLGRTSEETMNLLSDLTRTHFILL